MYDNGSRSFFLHTSQQPVWIFAAFKLITLWASVTSELSPMSTHPFSERVLYFSWSALSDKQNRIALCSALYTLIICLPFKQHHETPSGNDAPQHLQTNFWAGLLLLFGFHLTSITAYCSCSHVLLFVFPYCSPRSYVHAITIKWAHFPLQYSGMNQTWRGDKQ